MKFTKVAELQADDHILSLSWTNGRRLVVTPVTGLSVVADTAGAIVHELAEHGLGNGRSSATGDRVATCGFDGKVRLHTLDGSAETKTITLGRGVIETVAWSPNGKNLAVPQGKILHILDQQGETLHTFPDHQTSVSDCAWNPKKNSEITTVCGGGARMWRLGNKQPFAKFDWGGASLAVRWSADGRWIVTGDQTPSVHLYDFTRDFPLFIEGFETKVKGLDFSPDARRLATGGAPQITVWDCTPKTGPEGTTPAQLQYHQGDVEALAWSPNGKLLASGDIVGRVVISHFPGKPVSAFENDDAISALAWSLDGHYLASGNAEGIVTIFSLDSD